MANLFGPFAFHDGALAVGAASTTGPRITTRHMTRAEGTLIMVAELSCLNWLRLVAIALVNLVATWAITAGAYEQIVVHRLCEPFVGERPVAIVGIVSLVLGVLMGPKPRT